MTEDVRTMLLDAAAKEFTSPEYGILERVVLCRIAERAGVAERTARRYFTAEELRAELVSHLLAVRPGVDIGHEEMAAFTNIILDRNVPLDEALGIVADELFEHNLGNELLRAQAALWPYAANNPDIREGLLDLYEYWLHGAKAGLNDMIVKHADLFSLRPDWITVDDFVRGMTACIDGLAMQELLYRLREEDPDAPPGTWERPLDPKLCSKMIIAVFASMIARDGFPSVRELFADIEADRNPANRVDTP